MSRGQPFKLPLCPTHDPPTFSSVCFFHPAKIEPVRPSRVYRAPVETAKAILQMHNVLVRTQGRKHS